MSGQLSNRERLYYSRQMIMPGWDEETQVQLKESKVLVIGAGGLSCPMLQNLVRAGVGHIGIVDGDSIQYSNLHRQSLFEVDDVGRSKAMVAAEKLKSINPHVTIEVHHHYLTQRNAEELFTRFDIVADGTDNFPTRYLVNDYAVKFNLINVFAAINGFEGQLAVFNYPLGEHQRSGHYRDIFPLPPPSDEVPNCAEHGVLGTTTSTMGSLQAAEIIKVILRSENVFYNKLVHIDLQSLEQRQIQYIPGGEPDWNSISATEYDHKLCVPAKEEISMLEKYYEELLQLYREVDSLQWVDVRSKKEHLIDPFSGRNIPWNTKQNVSQYKTDRPVVFYCQTGKRSAEVLQLFLKQYPKAEAYSLKGGVEKWLYDSQKSSQ
ncbi:MAG TPA: HesA/MoeB/ThiF family protein [Saprospiraceae bacterium]|nr:HesA/MoeB/ThiF family protein [Saprospiraceae bacterium]